MCKNLKSVQISLFSCIVQKVSFFVYVIVSDLSSYYDTQNHVQNTLKDLNTQESLSLSLSLSLSPSNQIDALVYVSDLRVKICGVTGGAPSTLATIIYFQSTAKTAWKMLFMIYKVSTCLLYIFIIWPSICVVSWKWHFYCVATGCMRAYFNLLSISGVLCQPIFLSPTSPPASPHFISCYGSHGRK